MRHVTAAFLTTIILMLGCRSATKKNVEIEVPKKPQMRVNKPEPVKEVGKPDYMAEITAKFNAQEQKVLEQALEVTLREIEGLQATYRSDMERFRNDCGCLNDMK